VAEDLVTERKWEVYERPMAYMSEKFDRKAFNPDLSQTQRHTLATLRSVGGSRGWHAITGAAYPQWHGRQHDADHLNCCGSSALKALWQQFAQPHSGHTFIDVGCGNSGDVYIAGLSGYNAFALDLFSPSPDAAITDVLKANRRFVKADALELPFADGCADVIVCQAMIDLVAHSERAAFYREVRRVLKVGGVFSLGGISLRCGHGWKLGDEVIRARKIDGWEIDTAATGFIATRLEEGVTPQTPYSKRLYRNYVFYPTAEECAKQAAPIFTANRWRYSGRDRGRGYIPDEQDLLEGLRYLGRHKTGCECGRLAYYDGQFGYQRPR
jgi:ubiquinone/menaquinone biosynthesis C-methylase UbiE